MIQELMQYWGITYDDIILKKKHIFFFLTTSLVDEG